MEENPYQDEFYIFVIKSGIFGFDYLKKFTQNPDKCEIVLGNNLYNLIITHST